MSSGATSKEIKKFQTGRIFQLHILFLNVWHVHSSPKIWFDQNFGISRYFSSSQQSKKKSNISRTYKTILETLILHNNNIKKFWQSSKEKKFVGFF